MAFVCAGPGILYIIVKITVLWQCWALITWNQHIGNNLHIESLQIMSRNIFPALTKLIPPGQSSSHTVSPWVHFWVRHIGTDAPEPDFHHFGLLFLAKISSRWKQTNKCQCSNAAGWEINTNRTHTSKIMSCMSAVIIDDNATKTAMCVLLSLNHENYLQSV